MISLFFIMFMTVLVGFVSGLTPYISRKEVPFGVSLPITSETEPTIKAQKKSYFVINFGLGLLLGVIVFTLWKVTSLSDEMTAYLSIISLFLLLIVSFVTYISRNKYMEKYKKSLHIESSANKKILVDLSFRNEKLIFPTSYLVAINIIFILITLYVTITNYAKIPDTIVMQWDFNMQPSRVVDKTWLSVLSIPMLQIFLMVVMAISNQAFLTAKQQVDVNDPEESIMKNKKFRRKSSLLNYVISILTQLLFMMIQFSIIFEKQVSPQVIMGLSIGFAVLILGITIWYSLHYGQGGERLKNVETTSPNVSPEGQTFENNDNHWKLGIFYFNRKDPSFWVEKRMGVGMTVNLAKWEAWALMGMILVVPLLIAYFMS